METRQEHQTRGNHGQQKTCLKQVFLAQVTLSILGFAFERVALGLL